MSDLQDLRPGQFSLAFCLVLMTIISCVLGYIQLAGMKGLFLALLPPLLIGGLVHSALLSVPKYRSLKDDIREFDHSSLLTPGWFHWLSVTRYGFLFSLLGD